MYLVAFDKYLICDRVSLNSWLFYTVEKNLTHTGYWVDGSNLGHAKDWKYFDGSSMNTSNGLWEADATINDEHCARMKKPANYLLNDICCNNNFGYICEKSPV